MSMGRAYCNLGLAHLAIGNMENALECQKYFLGEFAKMHSVFTMHHADYRQILERKTNGHLYVMLPNEPVARTSPTCVFLYLFIYQLSRLTTFRLFFLESLKNSLLYNIVGNSCCPSVCCVCYYTQPSGNFSWCHLLPTPSERREDDYFHIKEDSPFSTHASSSYTRQVSPG
jgi:hypothetical protein